MSSTPVLPTTLPPVTGGCLCGTVRYRGTLPGTRLEDHTVLMERWKKAYGDNVAHGVDATRKG